MKRRIIRKEFVLEIKKSFHRFISIFFIVVLGVAFFTGIRATEPDMKISADAFYDESKLLDIRILSTYGLTQEDIQALEKLEEIQEIEGAYSKDVLCQMEKKQLTVRVLSLPNELNQIVVKEGRMPEKANECIVDTGFLLKSGYQVGDTITIKSGTDEALSETLIEDTYVIVGSCITSYYLSLERGTTTIGNGVLDSFIMVPTDNFSYETFTELYITVNGAEDLFCYSKEYETFIENVIEKIEREVQKEREQARYNSIREEAQKKVDEAKQELKDSEEEADKELSKAKNEIEKAEKEIEDGKAEITKSEKEIKEGKQTIKEGKKGLEEKKKELKQAEKDIKEGEEKLEEAKVELAEGEKELEKGKKEYKKEKKEAEQKIADAKEEIEEAEQKIEDIKMTEWYVLDRNTIQTYVEYEQDAERIGAVGEVFPIIFFLVAALVSLTTMTRMVEEQRTQIGTLKALGYSKITIAAKYLGYAFLATAGGSIAGGFLGCSVLPYIIINAYTIMYQNLEIIKTPFNLYYTVIAAGIAIACVLGATAVACWKELISSPAELMRPMAPKQGKRVLLERIPFIWKRLNFTRKSTVRNLIRYKKRFFMTIFGIGGCMALMLVGFGIRDSISSIVDLQYGKIHLYDVVLNLEEDRTKKEQKQIEEKLEADNRIKNKKYQYHSTIEIQKEEIEKTVNLIVLEEKEKVEEYYGFHERVSQRELSLSDTGVILSEKAAKVLKVKVGDTIFIKKENEKDIEVLIEGICENYVQHYMFMTKSYYQQLYQEVPDYNELLLSTDTLTEEEFDELAENLLEPDGITSVTLTKNSSGRFEDMLENLDIVIVVLIVSAGGLAFIVLYNLNNISINERKRELATIKVLGFYDIEVSQYVYRENIMLTIFGILLGSILGMILHKYVILTCEIDMIMFGRTIKGISYVYSTLLTCFFAVFINISMHFKLKKIDMATSLKSVE